MAKLPGEALSDADLAHLEKHYINKTWAEAAGFRRVSSAVAADLLGIDDNGKLAGIFIPYFHPDSREFYSFRIELDESDENSEVTQ